MCSIHTQHRTCQPSHLLSSSERFLIAWQCDELQHHQLIAPLAGQVSTFTLLSIRKKYLATRAMSCSTPFAGTEPLEHLRCMQNMSAFTVLIVRKKHLARRGDELQHLLPVPSLLQQALPPCPRSCRAPHRPCEKEKRSCQMHFDGCLIFSTQQAFNRFAEQQDAVCTAKSPAATPCARRGGSWGGAGTAS